MSKRAEFLAWEKLMLAQIVRYELDIVSIKREIKCFRALVRCLRVSLAKARKTESNL